MKKEDYEKDNPRLDLFVNTLLIGELLFLAYLCIPNSYVKMSRVFDYLIPTKQVEVSVAESPLEDIAKQPIGITTESVVEVPVKPVVEPDLPVEPTPEPPIKPVSVPNPVPELVVVQEIPIKPVPVAEPVPIPKPVVVPEPKPVAEPVPVPKPTVVPEPLVKPTPVPKPLPELIPVPELKELPLYDHPKIPDSIPPPLYAFTERKEQSILPQVYKLDLRVSLLSEKGIHVGYKGKVCYFISGMFCGKPTEIVIEQFYNGKFFAEENLQIRGKVKDCLSDLVNWELRDHLQPHPTIIYLVRDLGILQIGRDEIEKVRGMVKPVNLINNEVIYWLK